MIEPIVSETEGIARERRVPAETERRIQLSLQTIFKIRIARRQRVAIGFTEQIEAMRLI